MNRVNSKLAAKHCQQSTVGRYGHVLTLKMINDSNQCLNCLSIKVGTCIAKQHYVELLELILIVNVDVYAMFNYSLLKHFFCNSSHVTSQFSFGKQFQEIIGSKMNIS